MKPLFVSVVAFVVGIAAGIAFCQTDVSSVEASDQMTRESAGRSSTEGARAVHASVLNRITRLEHQVKILTARLGQIRSDTNEAKQASAQAAQEAPSLPAAKAIGKRFQTEIEAEGSVVRQAVGQIVRDEFKNMRSEWGAFRKARGELRDEEFIEELSGIAELNSEEKASIESMLATEREELRALRRKSRETFDIKGGRDSAKSRKEATDEEARALLGDERFDGWERLRERRQPPWRR